MKNYFIPTFLHSFISTIQIMYVTSENDVSVN